jgi:hypothetical protein
VEGGVLSDIKREEEKVKGSNERYYILGGGGREKFLALKVLRWCPLVLVVEVRFR